jgi:hypothetical protein
MAPSNLSQVFIANSATILDDADAFNTTAVAGSSKIGICNADTGLFMDTGTPADMMTLKRLQVVQTMPSGNPIASPIIDTKDIKRIKFTQYAASVRHSVAASFAATVPTGATYLVKIALRTTPTAYSNFEQSSATSVDLSGAGITFPLIGNFSAGRNISPVVEIAAGTTAANCGIAVTNAITNSATLSKLFTVSDNGAGVVTIVARHAGVVFDVVAFNTVTELSVISTSTTGYDCGVGNYWQALSDEKSQRSKYGNFNRMYFPMGFPEFAVSGRAYDVVEIQYEHNHPGSTGIARAAQLNSIKIYVIDTAAGSTVADTIFLGADAANWGVTNTERLF